MKHNNFSYLLGEGFRATFKHGFMSFCAVCITVACLVIVSSFGLITYNLNLMIKDIQKENRILACVDETYTDSQARSVGSKINQNANVSNAIYISREEVTRRFYEKFGAEQAEGLPSDTFRAQYEITLIDNGKTEQTAAELENIPGVALVNYDITMANAMTTIQKVLYSVAIAIAIVLVLVSLVIISNTIRLAMLDRREEIAIMKMVGATNGFIRLPFLMEGFLLGLTGAVCSFFIEWGIYHLIREAILSTGQKILQLVSYQEVMVPMAILCGVCGMLIGVFGSLMSIRRFLKV